VEPTLQHKNRIQIMNNKYILLAILVLSNTCIASKKYEYTLRLWEQPSGTSTLLYEDENNVVESIDKGESGKQKVTYKLNEKGFPSSYQSITTDADDKETKFVKENAVGFFFPQDYVPSSIALLANALINNNNNVLLSSGTKTRTKTTLKQLDKLSIKNAAGQKQNITLYTITGLDYLPLSVWLDDKHHLFAYIRGADEVIRKGHENNLVRLTEKQNQAGTKWLEKIAKELTRDHKKLLIHNARVFDVHTLETSPKTSVLIEGNKITQVGNDGSFTIPKGVEKIDAGGKFLMPGLWDNHVYYFEQHYGLLNIAAGVTSIREMGNAQANTLAQSKSNLNEQIGPRMVLAMRYQGDKKSRYGNSIPIIANEGDIKKMLETHVPQGYQMLRNVGNFNPDLMPAIKTHANKHGVHIVGEPPGGMTPGEYIEAGAQEILHLFNITRNLLPPRAGVEQKERFSQHQQISHHDPKLLAYISAAKKYDVALEPTLLHNEQYFKSIKGQTATGFEPYINHLPLLARGKLLSSRTSASNGVQAFDVLLKLVKFIHDSGIRLIPAAYLSNGYGLHYELELFVKAGIPNAKVLQMATYGSAKNMHMEDILGAIKAGQLADLILIDGDPTINISDLRKTHTVIRDGKVFDSTKVYSAIGIGSINR